MSTSSIISKNGGKRAGSNSGLPKSNRSQRGSKNLPFRTDGGAAKLLWTSENPDFDNSVFLNRFDENNNLKEGAIEREKE